MVHEREVDLSMLSMLHGTHHSILPPTSRMAGPCTSPPLKGAPMGHRSTKCARTCVTMIAAGEVVVHTCCCGGGAQPLCVQLAQAASNYLACLPAPGVAHWVHLEKGTHGPEKPLVPQKHGRHLALR